MAEPWLEAEARAKVNLGLRIYPRRPDGFHTIQTLFCRIDLADRLRLRLRSQPGVAIRVSGPESAPQGPDNLAARAAALFLEQSGRAVGVEIELEKRIPAGSGLGGGSSDAATVLRLLDQATASSLPHNKLSSLARQLGADVTFFAADVPLAFGSGRGDRLNCDAGLAPRPMLLVVPRVAVSTSEAYACWDEAQDPAADRVTVKAPEPGAALSWETLYSEAENDFEPVIFQRLPRLRALHEALSATAPSLALLTGSGSALFGVYESETLRDRAASDLEDVDEDVRLISARGPV
jgi:4-diphosphocytidyl-2-C-methyl-D-erythritol kinase